MIQKVPDCKQFTLLNHLQKFNFLCIGSVTIIWLLGFISIQASQASPPNQSASRLQYKVAGELLDFQRDRSSGTQRKARRLEQPLLLADVVSNSGTIATPELAIETANPTLEKAQTAERPAADLAQQENGMIQQISGETAPRSAVAPTFVIRDSSQEQIQSTPTLLPVPSTPIPSPKATVANLTPPPLPLDQGTSLSTSVVGQLPASSPAPVQTWQQIPPGMVLMTGYMNGANPAIGQLPASPAPAQTWQQQIQSGMQPVAGTGYMNGASPAIGQLPASLPAPVQTWQQIPPGMQPAVGTGYMNGASPAIGQLPASLPAPVQTWQQIPPGMVLVTGYMNATNPVGQLPASTAPVQTWQQIPPGMVLVTGYMNGANPASASTAPVQTWPQQTSPGMQPAAGTGYMNGASPTVEPLPPLPSSLTPNMTGANLNPPAASPTLNQDAVPPTSKDRLSATRSLNSSALQLQGVYVYQGDESSARARVGVAYPLTPNVLFGTTVDLTDGNAFADSRTQGLSLNELYLATSLQNLPNLRFVVGQLDLTSYFDRNSFAKDGASQFFNTLFQTNPALSSTGIGSRPGFLANWSITDNIEAKAAIFSSSREIGDFSLDGFAGEVGVRYGNAIIRGTYVSDRDAGARDGFREIYQLARGNDRTGPLRSDREESYGVNAEAFIPNLKMGLFARYGRYENRDLDRGGDTYSAGISFLDLFTVNDRLGIAYGRNLSNDKLRRQAGSQRPDVLEVYYDFRFLPHLRLGFTFQERNNFSETIFGFRVKTEFDVSPIEKLF